MEDIIELSKKQLNYLKDNSFKILKQYDDEIIESRYALQMKKTLCNVNNEAKAKKHIFNVNKISYSIDECDYVNYCYLEVILPKFSIRKEYSNVKAAWCNKIGINIINDSKVLIGNTVLQRHNAKTMDIISVLEMDAEEKDFYNKLIGVDDDLVTPTTEKESFTLFVPQLWFFSKRKSISLPKFLFQEEISFVYEFKALPKLIKLYMEQDGELKEIQYDEKYIEIGVLDTPDLYYKFSLVTDEEKKWVSEQRFNILIQDIVIHETKIQPLLNKFKYKFMDEGSCQAIIWTIEDNSNEKFNDYFDYLDYNDLHYDVTLSCDNDCMLLHKNNKIFSTLNQWYYCNSFSYTHNYNVIPFSNKIFLRTSIDTGLNLRDLKIKFNADIKHKVDKTYNVTFYVLLTKVLEIEKYKYKLII